MHEKESPYFELKRSGDYLRIETFLASYPHSALAWDRNWVDVIVKVKAGLFSGEFEAKFMRKDFIQFKDRLTYLYDKLKGYATFEELQHQVNIKVEGDGLGHFTAACQVKDRCGIGASTLAFDIAFDQTDIPVLLSQLSEIESFYL